MTVRGWIDGRPSRPGQLRDWREAAASSGAAVAVGVLLAQFAHAVGQVALVATTPFAGWQAASATGFFVAAGLLGLAVQALLTTRTGDESLDAGHGESPTVAGSSVGTIDGTDAAERSLGAVTAAPSGATGRWPARPRPVADGGVDGGASASVADYDEFVRECTATVEAAGDGNVSRRIDPNEAPSETLYAFAAEYNDTLRSFQQTVDTAAEFGDEVAGAASDVAGATGTVTEASENVAGTVDEIAGVFREQTEQVEEIADEMNSMSASVQEVAASTDQLSETASLMEDRAQSGIDAARQSMRAMEDADDRVGVVADTAETLDERMEEVDQIVELIADIADETHVLALNASIEAARAGESGAGFAVVADEVKSLADETQSATEEIEDVIDDVQDRTGTTVDEIQRLRETMDQGMEKVDEGVDALESVVDAVEETTAGVVEINQAADEQAASAQEVAAIATSAADTARENVEEAEYVAAVAEEQRLMLGEMEIEAKSLATRSQQLTSLFERYDDAEQ